MNNDLCVITGVGPGTGTALVRKFAEIAKIILLKPFNGLAQTAFLMYKKLIVGKITPET